MNEKDKTKKYKQAYEELKLILDLSFDQITIADGDGVFTRVSKQCESYFGVKESEIIGKNAFDLERQGVFDKSVTAEVLRKKEKIIIIQRTGGEKTLMVTGIPIYNDNKKIIKIINISKDITENTMLSKKLNDVEEELDWVKRELNKRNEIEEKDRKYQSLSMKKIMDLIYHISDSDATLLLLGETGVGKGHLTKIIHEVSNRREEKLIQINCGAIPENLLESELFGYEPGSFSGASKDGKKGLFEIAKNGTIFLDEIGDMPMNLQVKLLHVLDNKKVVRVGGDRSIDINARIIAATNKDLEKQIELGEFREDLFYRLNVVPITLPPIRERVQDIPGLIKIFLDRYNKQNNTNKSISEKAYTSLISYKYPGNIRELENIIERLAITSMEDTIKEDQVESIINPDKNKKEKTCIEDEIIPIKDAVNELEKRILISAFSKYKTTRKVAEALKIDQSTVVKKAKRLKIKRIDE